MSNNSNPNLPTPRSPTQPVCANCKHWQPQVQTCHRYPPVIIGVVDEAATLYPQTKAGDWCGEHEFQVQVQDQFIVKQTYNLP